MTEEIYLGPVPLEEECVQVGTKDYMRRSKIECEVFISQLKRAFGSPPKGSSFKILNCPHDFGTYREVVIEFNPEFPECVNWAFNVEENIPLNWDPESRRDLSFLVIG